MDKTLVLRKLDSIRRCVERAEEKRPESLEALEEDFDSQDIICINLERAIQTCADVALHILADDKDLPPDTMGKAFERLGDMGVLPAPLAGHMAKAAGFRNVAVHEYTRLNWAVVWSILTERLQDFKDFVSHILKHMDKT